MTAHVLADPRFRNQGKSFWANVRSISENTGYTNRKTGQIKVYTIPEMARTMDKLGLSASHICDVFYNETQYGRLLADYFGYRAEVLNNFVEPRLMDAAAAKELYEQMLAEYGANFVPIMNKQKGEKAQPAYLTGMVAMLIKAFCDGLPVDLDPRVLTTFTRGGVPLTNACPPC